MVVPLQSVKFCRLRRNFIWTSNKKITKTIRVKIGKCFEVLYVSGQLRLSPGNIQEVLASAAHLQVSVGSDKCNGRQSLRSGLLFSAKVRLKWNWPNGVGKSKVSTFWSIPVTNNVISCKKNQMERLKLQWFICHCDWNLYTIEDKYEYISLNSPLLHRSSQWLHFAQATWSPISIWRIVSIFFL